MATGIIDSNQYTTVLYNNLDVSIHPCLNSCFAEKVMILVVFGYFQICFVPQRGLWGKIYTLFLDTISELNEYKQKKTAHTTTIR